MFSHTKLTKPVAAAAAVLVIAAGGLGLVNSSASTSTSGTPNVAQAPQAHTDVSGKVPANWNPGDGTVITGATADKVKAAALAAYPGTVNRVLRLSDGTYAVHYFNTSGPHHVFVSKDFNVTGAAT